MGSQVIAKCNCGLERTIAYGGGKSNFRRIQYFPCFCRDCKDVVQGNLKSWRLKCPNCNSRNVIPYNNKALIGTKGDEVIDQSFDNIITNGTYMCPSCNEMNLKFQSGHEIWD